MITFKRFSANGKWLDIENLSVASCFTKCVGVLCIIWPTSKTHALMQPKPKSRVGIKSDE